VVDQVTSEPLSGAQVSLPALGRGQLTNATGQFLLLNVPVGEATVQVQYIGYGTETVTVQVRSGEVATVEFALGSRAINLDAMVVTGTGAPTQRRRLGQTISTVSQESLQNAVTGGSISDVLYGRVAGLTGLAKSETGASPLLLLRGTVSLSQRNQPLVYIDGVRMDNTPAQVSGTITNRLNDINPAEIERVEIIKGAAAATLFGTEASSGVIQIFTKRGVTQDPVFTAEIDQQFIHMPHSFWPVSAQYVGAESRVVTNKPAEDFVDPGYHPSGPASTSPTASGCAPRWTSATRTTPWTSLSRTGPPRPVTSCWPSQAGSRPTTSPGGAGAPAGGSRTFSSTTSSPTPRTCS
jgi:hypothetical protein